MRAIEFSYPAVGHAAPVTDVAFSPFKPWLASSSYDGSVVVWEITADGALRQLHRLRHRRLVNGAAWSPVDDQLLATASADKTIGVWRLGPDQVAMVGSLARHTDDVNGVAWAPDGATIVGASLDGRASLWATDSLAFAGFGTTHADHCMSAAVSAGGHLVTVGEDGQVVCRHLGSSGDARRQFPFSIEGCAWRPGRAEAALACDDGAVRLVSPELDVVETWVCAGSAVRSVSWLPDGDTLAVGSYDRSVRLVRSGRQLAVCDAGVMWPRSVAAGHGFVAVASFGASPVLLDGETLRTVSGGGPRTYGPNALAVSGRTVFVGTDSGELLAVDRAGLLGGAPTGGLAVARRQLDGSPILSLAAAGDDDVVAGTYASHVHRVTGGRAGSVRVDDPVTSLSVDRSRRRIVAGTYGGQLFSLALAAGGPQARARTTAHRGSIKAIAATGRGILTGGTDARVRYQGVDGCYDLWWHGNLVNDIAVHGAVAASASRDRLVHAALIDGASRVERHWDLVGADESVKSVAVVRSDQSTTVFGGSYDFGLYAWRLQVGSSAAPRPGWLVHEFGQAVAAAATIARDAVVVASWDGSLAVFDVGSVAGPTLRHAVHIADLVAADQAPACAGTPAETV